MSRTTIVLAALAAATAGCRGGAPSVGAKASVRGGAPAARFPGDALVYRFTDHAGEARVATPDLTAAWRAWSHPARLPSPYAKLDGEAALRVVEVALTDTDVADFGRPHKPASQQMRIDPVWNRTRAVYQSKTSLFAPTPSRYQFLTTASGNTRLRTSLAVAPGGRAPGPVEFIIEADGRPLLQKSITDVGVWLDVEIEIGSAREIAFVTRGGDAAPALFGDPLLIGRDLGAPGPNLLLVIIDTLRADAVAVMPRLRQLASTGVSFEQAITAATWTRPSLLALLGGDLPTALGQSAEEMIPPDVERRRFYAAAPPLLPAILQAAGWTATAIGNNFFLLGYPQIGLSFGFESVADVRHPVLDTPAIARAAEAFIEAHSRESWFLQVHFDGPHWPYTPPPEQLRRVRVPDGFPGDSMARAYLAEAIYSDDYLGRVLDALERADLRERTVVVVVGDHGEVFDHAHAHTVEALRQPTLHHHGWAAYDEILRVPLVIARPGVVPVERVGAQVSLIDVQPTVLELLGLPARSGSRGRTLAPLWSQQDRADRVAVVEGQNVRAVRDGNWLFLARNDGRLRDDRGQSLRVDEELYDLHADPTQHRNLAGAQTEQLARMRTRMKELAPAPPEGPTALLHLRVAPDKAAHVVEATLTSEGRIALRGKSDGQVIDEHRVTATLKSSGQLDVAIDPPDAALTLAIKRDGIALTGARVMVGSFGLPLLDGTPIRVQGERLRWLESARPPPMGERGDVLLWRDPARTASVGAAGAEANAEVGNMMRRWGYAQPGK